MPSIELMHEPRIHNPLLSPYLRAFFL
ncbi:uncharacterized protein METZ01_LOCUS399631, partial [marine metagenome]